MTYSSVISYPIPAFQNLPIEAQYYLPSRFVISGITLGSTTIVTTTEPMNYVIGQQVRLVIPPTFGCRQLNQITGYVIGIPAANEVTLNLSSIGIDTFIASTSPTQAQIVAIGDVNNGAINRHGRYPESTFIPGSFINISPE
jgi:hypothetical protein